MSGEARVWLGGTGAYCTSSRVVRVRGNSPRTVIDIPN